MLCADNLNCNAIFVNFLVEYATNTHTEEKGRLAFTQSTTVAYKSSNKRKLRY